MCLHLRFYLNEVLVNVFNGMFRARIFEVYGSDKHCLFLFTKSGIGGMGKMFTKLLSRRRHGWMQYETVLTRLTADFSLITPPTVVNFFRLTYIAQCD